MIVNESIPYFQQGLDPFGMPLMTTSEAMPFWIINGILICVIMGLAIRYAIKRKKH